MDQLALLSPTNGRPLRSVSANLLDDGDRLWPVLEGIPYLRPRDSVRESAVAAVVAGDLAMATVLLLRDQDDFSPTAPPTDAALLAMLQAPPATLREAMRELNYGPVADYFAYRWCSPTFLSGLRLLELSVSGSGPTVEYACGIGHFLRELELADVVTVGIDIVYSKLWLARRYLDVRGTLICGDVEQSPVVDVAGACTVFCHDAFYFLHRKASALSHMRTVAGTGGRVAVGHVHTDRDPHRVGDALPGEGYRRLTPAIVWDDAGLADDFRQSAGLPREASGDETAVAWLEGERVTPQYLNLKEFRGQTALNPLLSGGKIAWPSEGWKKEFMADAGQMVNSPLQTWRSYVTQRVELEVGNTLDESISDRLVGEGILLNLPERW